MSFEIEVNAGSSVKLPTAGKYCDRDIVVTATDGDGGYDEGYADGVAKVEESNAAILTDCNAVLPDKGVEPADTLEQVPQRIGEIESYADGYDVGVEDGKQAEYDRFWDAYQANGNRRNYEYAFRADYSTTGGFTADVFHPKYDIIVTGSANFMFANFGRNVGTLDMASRLAECGVVLDLSGATSLNQAFVNSWVITLPTMDISNSSNNMQCFGGCLYLKTIEKLIVSDGKTYNNTFINCTALENIVIEGVVGTSISFNNSSKLTDASVQSIIDHLKDLTGATAQTLTFHETVGAKLTQTQKDAISAKNWTLVY